MSVVTVTILSDGQRIDETHELLSVDVRRDVNRIPSACLEFQDGDLPNATFPLSEQRTFEPGKVVEIKARYETTSDATLFKGVVVRHGIEAGVHGSVLRVEMKDAAIKLTQARKSCVFRDQSDSDVIRKLVQAAGLKAGRIATTQPNHKELVQYQCSDWDFIVSRADAQSLLTVVRNGEVSAEKVSLGGAAKIALDYGSEIYDFEFEADAVHQYTAVKSRGWDVKDQKITAWSTAKAVSLAQGNLDGGRIAKAVGFGPYSLSNLTPLAPVELQAWADARMQRSRMSMLRGRISTQGLGTLDVLDLVKLNGMGGRFNGKALVTGVCHRVGPDGWKTDIQFGLSPRSFYLEEGIRDTPAAGLVPGVSGLQVGVVADFAEDPDKQLRVKLRLPSLDNDGEALWARLVSPDAGKERGFFFRPEVGDEVVVGFLNDDPRQPVILGAMYSSKNNGPKDFKLSKDNLQKGIVTKAGTRIVFVDDKKASLSIETASKNSILLDDDKKQIAISDQHGNTFTMNKDGITAVSCKDLTLEAKGNVVIKGAKVDVK